MEQKYSPYYVKNGKEYTVNNTDGEIFAGSYYEKKINSTEDIAIGVYDDPIRGNDMVASYPYDSLFEGLFALGNNREIIIENIVKQIYKKHGVTYIGRGCDWFDDYVDIDPNTLNFDIFEGDEEVEQKMSKVRYMFEKGSNDLHTLGFDVGMEIIEEKLRLEHNDISIEDVLKFAGEEEQFVNFAKNNGIDIEKEQVDRVSRISRYLLNRVGNEGDKVSISKCIKNNKNIVLDLEGVNIKNMESMVSNLLIWKILDNKYSIIDNPHFITLNNVVYDIDPNTDLFNKLMTKSRSRRLGLLLSEKQLSDAIINPYNIKSFIIGQINDNSEAARAGQVYDRGGKEVQELEDNEVLLRPITSDGFVSEMTLKARVFPQFKPGFFE